MPFLVVAGVLWGTGGLLGRLLADATGLSSLAVAAYRLSVGGVLLLGHLLLTGRRVPATLPAWRRVLAVGILAALFQGCYFTAVAWTSVSLATLVTIGSAPVLVLVVSRAAADGRQIGAADGRQIGAAADGRQIGAADGRQIGAACLALLGLGLLVGTPGAGSGPGAVLVGALFAVLAGAGFAAMTLLATRPVRGLDEVTTTGVGFAVGGALLLPGAAAVSGVAFAPDPMALGLLVAFGTVPTAIAYTCYFRGLRTATAGVGALVALLEPLTAAVLAALLLGERLGVVGVVGAVLLGTAVVLAARGAPRLSGDGYGSRAGARRRRCRRARAASR